MTINQNYYYKTIPSLHIDKFLNFYKYEEKSNIIHILYESIVFDNKDIPEVNIIIDEPQSYIFLNIKTKIFLIKLELFYLQKNNFVEFLNFSYHLIIRNKRILQCENLHYWEFPNFKKGDVHFIDFTQKENIKPAPKKYYTFSEFVYESLKYIKEYS